MKTIPLLLTLSALLFAVPSTLHSKDKKKDNDDDRWKKEYKETRHDAEALRTHYGQVRDRVKNLNSNRESWQQLRELGAEVERVSGAVDSGRYDPRELRNRIRQVDQGLTRLSQQVSNNNGRRNYDDDRRGDDRDNRDRNYRDRDGNRFR